MEKPSTARIALKWGLFSAIAIIVLSTILYVTGLWKTQWTSSLSYLFLIGGIVMAMREFRELNQGFLGYGEGVSTGSLVGMITGVLTAFFGYIYNTFIDTTIMQQMKDIQIEQMEARGMTEDQIEKGMEMAAMFMSPGIVFILGVLVFLLIGLLISLIVAAILKKDKPVFE